MGLWDQGLGSVLWERARLQEAEAGGWVGLRALALGPWTSLVRRSAVEGDGVEAEGG